MAVDLGPYDLSGMVSSESQSKDVASSVAAEVALVSGQG